MNKKFTLKNETLKLPSFLIVLLLFSSVTFSQTTVSKTYNPGVFVTIDGCGSYCSTLPAVTFTAADFPSGKDILDVNVSITWTKTDGTCTVPQTGSSFHSETNFRLDGPTGINEILAQPATWSGSASISTLTTVLDQAAGSVIGGINPVSGTFRPNVGNLSNYNDTNALGAWFLRAGDTGGGDPLCVEQYTVTITADDLTDPVITCPSDVILCYGAEDTTPANTGTATAIDDVDGAIGVSYSDVVVPGTGNEYQIFRTWMSTDANSNVSSCGQIITVNDDVFAPSVVTQDPTLLLDAMGYVTLNPADVDNGSTDDFCGCPAPSSLETLYSAVLGTQQGGVVYFNITVGASDIDITSFDINTPDPGAFTMDVYVFEGTYVGNQDNPVPWGSAVAVGSGVGAGLNLPSTATLDNAVKLLASTTYAVALHLDATHSHWYTAGNGANQNYSNGDITLDLGSAANELFNPSFFDPRVWNGSVGYCVASGSSGTPPFLAFETTSFPSDVSGSSPTDELHVGVPTPYEASAFTVPTTGNYTFNMTSPYVVGYLIIWDDIPVPNSGKYDTRPEYVGNAGWLSNGTLLSPVGTDVFSFVANKTYYMSTFDNAGGFSTFNTTIDMPIRSTAASTTFSCKDIGSYPTILHAFDAAGNTSSGPATVTIDGALTTHAGGSWDNGAPNLGSLAVIDDMLVTGGTSIEACACDVFGSLAVEDGDYLLVSRDITVNAGGTLTVEHQGSVVQIDDNASVTNNGIIKVQKTTPIMAPKSFMVSGSPMTGETREGVFGPAYIVRHHNTGNFIPNGDVAAADPAANNFADDNGNNWLTHVGGLDPGEGYMVFPQIDGTDAGVYTQIHTAGTLNNGVVNFTLLYNGTQNGSPSILANPYASAIDVEVFFDDPANADINVVYFWEHITPLSTTYPGYNVANFDMGDISLYSEALGAGVAAANGGAAPNQFISSGQGFGVKPSALGMAEFNNAMRVTGPNDTYRSANIVERDRLWIHVYNDTYGMGSTALIGFTENTSDAFINSEDVHRLPTPVSLYSELETGEELVVNALGTFEPNDAIYLSFNTQVKETQEYRISMQDMDGVNLENASVYLIDNLTGSVTNLTEGDYTFESGEAVYNKRFKIVFESSVLGTNDLDLESITLYPNPTQNTVTIVSSQLVLDSASVYDIQGRKVSEVDFRNQTNYQIDLSSMEAAVYFIQIATKSGTVVKRVIKK